MTPPLANPRMPSMTGRQSRSGLTEQRQLRLRKRLYSLTGTGEYSRRSSTSVSRFRGGDQELLFLRGRNDEVESARRIAEQLDGLYPAGEDPGPITSLSLTSLSAGSMRDKILALSGQVGLGLAPEQLIIFPDKTGGSLFFRGTASAVSQVREIKKELDQSRHESLSDLIFGFLRGFREDLSVHFLTVSTYAASAVLLLIIHFILIHLPWVGKFYQRWFTLIWTRLINDVKGRGVAFEVIKSLAETAVETVEQESLAAGKNNKSSKYDVINSIDNLRF